MSSPHLAVWAPMTSATRRSRRLGDPWHAPGMGNASLRALRVAGLALALGLAACASYDYPAGNTPRNPLERSWYATLGAMHDAGLEVHAEDRVHGRIEGRRGSRVVIANVSTDRAGEVRVQFSARGASPEDAALRERVARAYDERLKR